MDKANVNVSVCGVNVMMSALSFECERISTGSVVFGGVAGFLTRFPDKVVPILLGPLGFGIAEIRALGLDLFVSIRIS